MNRNQQSVPQFAICVSSPDTDLLTPRMVYRILPDESAKRSNYLRVVDNEGEDYLYPAENFVILDVPKIAGHTLLTSFPDFVTA